MTATGPDDAPAPVAVPLGLKRACALVYLESALMFAAGIALVVLMFVHDTTKLWGALVLAGLTLLVAWFLYAAARGLLQLHAGFRTPVTLVQVLAVPVSVGLVQGGRWVIGLPILVLVLAVLVLLYGRESRQLLDRQI